MDDEMKLVWHENYTKSIALLKKHSDVTRLNAKIVSTAKASYLAGDSPEVFFQKVGAVIEELGKYIKKNFE